MLDEEAIVAWLALATANLLVLGGVVAAIWKLVIRQRAIGNAQRLRLARWRRVTGEQAPPAA